MACANWPTCKTRKRTMKRYNGFCQRCYKLSLGLEPRAAPAPLPDVPRAAGEDSESKPCNACVNWPQCNTPRRSYIGQYQGFCKRCWKLHVGVPVRASPAAHVDGRPIYACGNWPACETPKQRSLIYEGFCKRCWKISHGRSARRPAGEGAGSAVEVSVCQHDGCGFSGSYKAVNGLRYCAKHCPLYDDNKDCGICGMARDWEDHFDVCRYENFFLGGGGSNPFGPLTDGKAQQLYKSKPRLKHNLMLLACNQTEVALHQSERQKADGWVQWQVFCDTHQVWYTPWYVLRYEWAYIHRLHFDGDPAKLFRVLPGKGQWDHEWGTGDKTWYYGNPKDLIPPNVVDYPVYYDVGDGPWRLLYEELMRETDEAHTDGDTSAMTAGASHASTWEEYDDVDEEDLLQECENDQEKAFWTKIDAGTDPWERDEDQ